ncbi:MAG: sugar nucleotide-binding protein [Alphaproteobacteria bacterium]|nr:sugar nucleotide-binding protein [Alphaproteobacteria bacterium]
MVTRNILVFGGGGQVGQALLHTPLPTGLNLIAPPREACDITDAGDLARAMHEGKPDLVINTAAIAGIEACEENPDLAMRVNFEAVAAMAAHCTERSIPFIQISTDYVFDGADGAPPYLPDAAMNPLNVYGHSKMMGEEAARHGTHWHVILRTALVFSAFGENILTRTLRGIDTQDEITVAADQVASPTGAEFLAEGTLAVAAALLGGKSGGFGTFHLAGGPPASRFDFLQAVMESYAPFTERRPTLIAGKAANMPKRIPRPLYSALDCEKIHAVYGIAQRGWRDDLARAVRQLAARKAA